MPIDIDTNIRILNADSIRNILSGVSATGGSGSAPSGSGESARAAMSAMPWAASAVANAYASSANQAAAIADFVRNRGASTSGGWTGNGDFWRSQMNNAVGGSEFMRTFGRDIADSGRRVVETMNMLSRAGYGAEEALRRVRENMNIGQMTTGEGWVSGRQRFIEGLARFSDRYNRIFDTNRWGTTGGSGGDRDAQANSFARAFFRVMASRSLMGAVNLGFEYAKNPLHDNFAINTAQKTANTTINTLATTGRVDLALISGLTTLLMSSIERRNALHVQQYQFDQRSLDTRRTFAQQRSDWSFNQLFAMYSRGEQQNMLQARADRIRGKVTEYTISDGYGNPAASFAVEEARKKYYEAIKKDQALARSKAISSTPTSGPKTEKDAAGTPGSGNTASKLSSPSAKNEGESVWATIKGWFTGGSKQTTVQKESDQRVDSVRETRREQGKKWVEEQKKQVSGENKPPVREEIKIAPQNEGMLQLAANLGGIGRRRKELEKAYADIVEKSVKETQAEIKGASARELIDPNKISKLKKIQEDAADKKGKVLDQIDVLSTKSDQIVLDKKIKDRNAAADAASVPYDPRPAGLRSGGPREYKPVGMRTGNPTGGPRIKPVGDPKAYVDPEKTAKYHYSSFAISASMSEEARAAQEAYRTAVSQQNFHNSLKVGGTYSSVVNTLKALEENKSKAENSTDITTLIDADGMDRRAKYEGGYKYEDALKLVRKALGKKENDKITMSELSTLSTKTDKITGANTPEAIAAQNLKAATTVNSSQALEEYKKSVVEQVRNGSFKETDMQSLKAVLKIAREQGINPSQDESFKQIESLYAVQERRAEELEFRRFQSKYDINQVMGQYTDANRVTDVMAKQGFFIGSQVDVQDVNKDILAEVRKMMPLLTKMAGKEVGFSEVGFLTNSNFK